MLTHLKSTMRVLCVLCMLTGQVTLLRGKIQPPKLFTRQTYGAGRPHVGLCPIFLAFIVLFNILTYFFYLRYGLFY